MDSIDLKKILEEGGKEFDAFASLECDDGSGDEAFIPVSTNSQSEDLLTNKKKGNAMHHINVYSLKVEGNKGEEISFDDTYVDMRRCSDSFVTRKRDNFVNEIMKKSVIGPDFENLESVPPYEIGKRKLLKEKRKKRESTKGENWFNMKAVEMTDEIKNDLQVLQMRSAIDPKHFYKKNDMKKIPKYFQLGTVVESPADFYSSRVPKKQRKHTLVDELMADAEFQRYSKQRYKEIIEGQKKTKFKAQLHASRLKRKGKS